MERWIALPAAKPLPATVRESPMTPLVGVSDVRAGITLNVDDPLFPPASFKAIVWLPAANPLGTTKPQPTAPVPSELQPDREANAAPSTESWIALLLAKPVPLMTRLAPIAPLEGVMELMLALPTEKVDVAVVCAAPSFRARVWLPMEVPPG